VLKLGERARIETRVTEMGRSSIKFLHTVFVGDEKAAEAREVRVYAGRDEAGAVRARPVDDDVRAALTAFN